MTARTFVARSRGPELSLRNKGWFSYRERQLPGTPAGSLLSDSTITAWRARRRRWTGVRRPACGRLPSGDCSLRAGSAPPLSGGPPPESPRAGWRRPIALRNPEGASLVLRFDDTSSAAAAAWFVKVGTYWPP